MRDRAVICDVDGTLVDSNDAHAAAWRDVLRDVGVERPFDEIRRLIGMGGDKLLPALTGISADSDEGKRITERRGQRFRDAYVAGLRPFPGVRALLARIAGDGFRLGIASSAKQDELDRLLRIAGVEDLIERRTKLVGVGEALDSAAGAARAAGRVVDGLFNRTGEVAGEILSKRRLGNAS